MIMRTEFPIPVKVVENIVWVRRGLRQMRARYQCVRLLWVGLGVGESGRYGGDAESHWRTGCGWSSASRQI